MLDNLSHFELNGKNSEEMDVDEPLHDDCSMTFLWNDVPWYGDFTNYLICGSCSEDLITYQ